MAKCLLYLLKVAITVTMIVVTFSTRDCDRRGFRQRTTMADPLTVRSKIRIQETRRLVQTAGVDRPLSFLASDAARMVSGATLNSQQQQQQKS